MAHSWAAARKAGGAGGDAGNVTFASIGEFAVSLASLIEVAADTT